MQTWNANESIEEMSSVVTAGELKIIFLKFEFREKYLPNIIMKLTPTQGVQYLWLYLTFS